MLPKVRICAAGKLTYVGNGIVMERFTEAGGAGALIATGPWW